MTEKKNLRKQIKSRIEKLDPAYIKESNAEIVKNILNSPIYKNAVTVFTFVSMNREIDTFPVIQDALVGGKTVCVPKCFSDTHMEARKISNPDDIDMNDYRNTPGAKDSCPPAEKENIDLALVPCLAADRNGYRLGYGGGYYDIYLKDFKGTSIILCREECMFKSLPIESHDIPAMYYITENGLFLAQGGNNEKN